MKTLISFLLLCNSFFLFGQQNEIDSLKSAIKNQKGVNRILSLNELSWYYKHIDIDSSLYFAKTSVLEATRHGDKATLGTAYTALGNTFDGIQLDSSEFYHKKALEIQKALNNPVGVAASYNNLGIIYDLNSSYLKSLEMYFDALKIYESLNNDPYSVAMVLGNIGIVYKKLKEYNKVLEYYDKALEIYTKVGSEFGITVTNGNIGFVLINLKRFDESIEYSNKAIDGYIKAEYLQHIPTIEHNLAIAYDSLDNHTQANKYYESAIAKHGENHNFNELANTYLSYSDFLFRQKDYLKGMEAATMAVSNAQRANATGLIIDATKYQAKHAAAIGSYKEAIVLYENYNIGKDSLFEENKTKQIFELQTKYETEKKDHQLLAQEIEIKEKSIAIQRQIALIVFLIVVVLFVYWWFRVKKKQQQIQSRLAINQERTRIAMDLHDHLGAELTLACSKLDTRIYKTERQSDKEKLVKIADQIRDANATLRETVWSIHHETIQVDQLLNRIESFANKMLEGSDKKYIGQTNLPNFTLTPQQALALFRIGQEAITNAFKYAKAQTIDLNIDINLNQLIMRLTDNGEGFSVEEVASGYGLQNMEQRAHQIGAQLSITSRLNEGTTISLIVPLK